MATPIFPNGLDVFVPLLDGYHPITAGDINERLTAIERIQQALGWGTIDNVAGPKGNYTDVATRLSSIFETDGGLKDIAFVTGSTHMGRWSEDYLTQGNPRDRGMYIPFGKTITGGTMSSGGYAVLFSTMVQDGMGERNFPGIWWVVNRNPEGVTIGGRRPWGANRGHIGPWEETQILYSVLAIGPLATVNV